MPVPQEELRKQDKDQRRRRDAYARDLMVQRIERDEKRLLEEKARQQELLEERSRMWTKNNNDRLALSTMTTEFDKTGELKLPAAASKGFDELVKSNGVPFDGEDRNPDAIQVESGVPIRGSVEHGESVTYKAFVEKAKMVKFEANRSGVNVFVGNGEVSHPTKRKHIWSKGNKFSVFHVEKSFKLGWFYVTVEGAAPASNACTRIVPRARVTDPRFRRRRRGHAGLQPHGLVGRLGRDEHERTLDSRDSQRARGRAQGTETPNPKPWFKMGMQTHAMDVQSHYDGVGVDSRSWRGVRIGWIRCSKRSWRARGHSSQRSSRNCSRAQGNREGLVGTESWAARRVAVLGG